MPTPSRVIGNSKGESQNLLREYKQNLEFHEGWVGEIQTKRNPLWEGRG